MTSKHTPGPWAHDSGSTLVITEEYIIADCTAAALPESEQEANARLMAAAPELLEACKDALEFIDFLMHDSLVSDGETRNMLRAAIAKAEGE